jgi:RND family efflux transporter MFP subunit
MEKQKPAWFMGVVQLVFVVAVIALALFFSSALKPETDSKGGDGFNARPDAGISVSATNPVPRTFSPQVRLNGIVTARTQTNITPQVSGQVIKVSDSFKQGATLKKGQVLFEIDPSDYRLAVEQAQANISAATSDLKVLEAEANLAIREWTELFPNEQISDLAARKPQMAAAQARLDGAFATKQTAELALARTKVRTLDDVMVLSTGLNKGQIVTPNQSVGQVFAIGNIEIAVPLSIDDLQTLTPVQGRDARLLINGDANEVSTGKVVRVDAVLDQRTRLANLFVRPDNPSELTVGSFVDVLIDGPTQEGALAVPESSMAGRDKVWVLSNGVLSSRRVKRLGDQDGFVVLSGFDTADGVLSLPPIEVFEGQKATIRETNSVGGPN